MFPAIDFLAVIVETRNSVRPVLGCLSIRIPRHTVSDRHHFLPMQPNLTPPAVFPQILTCNAPGRAPGSQLVDHDLVKLRVYHNLDPPRLHQLWHSCRLGPNAAEGFPRDLFELFSVSQPCFDRKGLIVAEVSGRVVGFVHAGFAPNREESGLDHTRGQICALMVHPEFRRQGIGKALVREAEQYLHREGASTVTAGAGLNQNGFYCGIYGGLEASGFCSEEFPAGFLTGKLGYQPGERTLVFRRDLKRSRDPVSARLLRHRRSLSMVITDRNLSESWWWFSRFGHLDSLRFDLKQRDSEQVVASAQIIGMDLFIPKWGVRSVGLRGVNVPEEARKQGYGQSLLLEICRRLRNESVQLVEAHVADQNTPATQLFRSSGFECRCELLTWTRTLDGPTG